MLTPEKKPAPRPVAPKAPPPRPPQRTQPLKPYEAPSKPSTQDSSSGKAYVKPDENARGFSRIGNVLRRHPAVWGLYTGLGIGPTGDGTLDSLSPSQVQAPDFAMAPPALSRVQEDGFDMPFLPRWVDRPITLEPFRTARPDLYDAPPAYDPQSIPLGVKPLPSPSYRDAVREALEADTRVSPRVPPMGRSYAIRPIEIEFGRNALSVRLGSARNVGGRREKRRNDRKTHMATYGLIDATFGRFSEAQDFAEAVMANTYWRGMSLDALGYQRSMHVIWNAPEHLHVDWVQLMFDLAMQEATDRAIGKMSRASQAWANEAGWSSPKGLGIGPAM